MSGDMTRFPELQGRGDPGAQRATDRMFAAVQGELRRKAGGLLKRERRDPNLQPSQLVHEACLRLFGGLPLDCQSRAHCFGIAATAMRRLPAEQARRRAAKMWLARELAAGVRKGGRRTLSAADGSRT